MGGGKSKAIFSFDFHSRGSQGRKTKTQRRRRFLERFKRSRGGNGGGTHLRAPVSTLLPLLDMCTCGALLPKLVLLPLGERRRGTALTPPLKTHAGPQRAATTTVPCVTNGQRSSFSSCCKKDAWMVGSLQKRGNGPLPRINKEKEREEPFAIVHKNCKHEYEGKTKSRTYSPKCPRRDIPVLASPSPSGQSLKGNVLAQMRGSIVKMSAIMVQNEAWLLLPLRSLPPFPSLWSNAHQKCPLGQTGQIREGEWNAR